MIVQHSEDVCSEVYKLVLFSCRVCCQSDNGLTQILCPLYVFLVSVPKIRRLSNFAVLDNDRRAQPTEGGFQSFPSNCVVIVLEVREFTRRELESEVDKGCFLLLEPSPVAVGVTCGVSSDYQTQADTPKGVLPLKCLAICVTGSKLGSLVITKCVVGPVCRSYQGWPVRNASMLIQ